MKLAIRENPEADETCVTVEYAVLEGEAEAVLRALNSIDKELLGCEDNMLVKIPLDTILYCESVDGKAFVYLRDRVIESPLRLFEIEDRVRNTGFVRASRTMLANMGHVKGIRPFASARLQLLMDNGEYLMVSRQFAPPVKKMLGIN